MRKVRVSARNLEEGPDPESREAPSDCGNSLALWRKGRVLRMVALLEKEMEGKG